jgi:hypothetical protein
MAANGFFAVGRQTFISACGLGINPACAFLVMACGTGKDNVSTRWSAEAVGNHAGMRWSAAKEAIEALCSAELVTKGGKPARPSYKLKKEGELIWLPSALVEGAANEVPPIVKMRQTQDPMTVRLLVELYLSQNLREDGGISTKTVYAKHERRQAGNYGSYIVWDFGHDGEMSVWWTDVTTPHMREVPTAEEKKANKNKGVDFFRRFCTLQALGLVEWVPYLFDGPKGEPIHALAWNGLDVEKDLYKAATAAAARILGGHALDLEGYGVPVQKHIAEVAMVGVARLKYRPHTALTSAWWAEHQSVCSGFIAQYNDIAATQLQANGTFDTPF